MSRRLLVQYACAALRTTARPTSAALHHRQCPFQPPMMQFGMSLRESHSSGDKHDASTNTTTVDNDVPSKVDELQQSLESIPPEALVTDAELAELQEVSEEVLSAQEVDELTRELADQTEPTQLDEADNLALEEELAAEAEVDADPDWYLHEPDVTHADKDAELAADPDWMPRWKRSSAMTDAERAVHAHSDTAWLADATTPWSVADTERWLALERAEKINVLDVRAIADWTDWMVIAEASTQSRLIALAEGLTREIRHRQRRVRKLKLEKQAMDGTTDQTAASPFATPNPPIPADARHLDDAPSISGRDPPSDWIVVDADRQSIHLFLPEMRATYDLDTVWQRRLFRHGQHLADIDESVQLTEEEEEKQAEQ